MCRTSGVKRDDRTRDAGDRSRSVSEIQVVVVGTGCRRRWRVVGDDTEVIGGTSRRRSPVVRRTTDDVVGKWDPLPDRAILDDVVVGRTSQLTGIDVCLSDRR